MGEIMKSNREEKTSTLNQGRPPHSEASPQQRLLRVSGRSVRFCTLSGAFLTSVEVPIERRAVDTKLLRHLTC